MPGLRERRPRGLPRYLELIQRLQRTAGHPLWFRGCGKAQHKLVPSLYRHPKKTSATDLQELEHQLLTRFRLRSIPHHSRNLSDDWEALLFCAALSETDERVLGPIEHSGWHYFALMSAASKRSRRGPLRYAEPAFIARLAWLGAQLRAHLIKHHAHRWRRLSWSQRLTWSVWFVFQSKENYGDPAIEARRREMLTVFYDMLLVLAAMMMWFVVSAAMVQLGGP